MPPTPQLIGNLASSSLPDPDIRFIGPVGLDRMDEILIAVLPMLAPALEDDGWKVGIDDLRGLLLKGGFQLFVALDVASQQIIAAVVTEILDYPKARVFSLAFCGGTDLERWAGWVAALEDLARDFKCRYIRIAGRKGWGRIFPDYQERSRIFEKDLQDTGRV